MDFDVGRCTRRCAASERELAPGEAFYSVLRAEGAEVVRCDYAADAWDGPPEECLGWWKSRMPARDDKQHKLAPNDVMWQLFQELAQRPDKQDMRYVLALLLVRRRVLQLEEAAGEDPSGDLVLYCARDETTHRVAAATPDEHRIEQIQEELARLLFADSS